MSLKNEIPGVNNAVQKLGELAGRMRADDFGFRDNDVDNIDKVIDSLHELETERKKMHEELEKETIKSSVLRHQLRVLPGQIRDEIMEAVMSARMSNANVLLELQEKLKAMNNQITALDKQARELEQENATLHPERELLKQQHEEIISQLNQRMAEKASMQIALNETRDKVRQANQDIVDLEDGILQLKEDLIQERTEARQEKKRLSRAVTDTTMKTKEQKDQNVNKKQELDTFQEKLMDSEGKLDAVRKNIRRYETSRAKLEGEERALGTQLSKQLKMNDQTRIKGAQIMNERVLEERNFIQIQQDLMDRIKQYEIDTKAEGLRSHELDQTKVELLLDLKKNEETMADDAERVAELDATLQASKGGLNTKAEEVGAMKRENIDMSEQIEELGESHKYIIIGFDENDLPEDIVEKDYSLYDPANFDPAVLAQLNNQIEEYKEQLSKERKERMEIQSQKESVAKTLDDLKSENQIFMTEMTNVVQGGKKQHQELSNEGMQLQRQLKEDEEQIGKLTGNLEDAQRKYQAMFDDYQKRTDMMEEEVLSLEQALEAKKRELEEKIPSFQDLEIHFKQRNEEYDATKKAVVGMKNKKTSLEEQIKRMKREKEALKEPQVALRKELQDKRQQLMGQLHTQGSSTQEMEQEILTAGCKLRAVVEENHKFDESCKKLEAELAELEKEMAMNERIKEKLQADLTMQKRELMKKWEADNMMQEFFASRDKATAEAFGRLLSRTEKRENKIDMITERLKEELSTLGGFLDTISTRRPAESKASEGSLSPGKVIEAVAGANHKNDRSLGSPDTAATLTMTAGVSSPSPRSVRQPLAPRSTLNSRLGTSQSRQSEYSSDMTPRSVLKSPHGRGKHSPTKSTTFADLLPWQGNNY